jgi:hypothetical protein
MRGGPSGCCLCGHAIEALVEDAHVPDRSTAPDDIARLCVLCHRAYDLGLMRDDEIRDARASWSTGGGAPYAGRVAELHALWGSRKPDWRRLQKGAQTRAGRTLRRKAAARRAAATRRANTTPP